MSFRKKNYLALYTLLTFGAAGYLLGPVPIANLVVGAVTGALMTFAWAAGCVGSIFNRDDEILYQIGAFPGLILFSGLTGLAVASEAVGIALILAWVAAMFFVISALPFEKPR